MSQKQKNKIRLYVAYSWLSSPYTCYQGCILHCFAEKNPHATLNSEPPPPLRLLRPLPAVDRHMTLEDVEAQLAAQLQQNQQQKKETEMYAAVPPSIPRVQHPNLL